MSGAAKLDRERDYHNHRFANETREDQAKYYAAVKDGAEQFTTQLRLRALSQQADVLEYGCGNIPALFDVATICRSATGIDISDVVVDQGNKRARTLGLTNVHFETMNAEQMTFANDSFDLVFGRGIIHHLDIDRSFEEIARVLRPNGTAMFWEPLGHNLLLKVYRRLTPDARTPDEHPLVRGDFDLACRHFGLVSSSFYGLTSLLSVPFRGTPVGDAIFKVTGVMDRMLFRIPGMQWQAWYCLLNLGLKKEFPQLKS